MAVYRQTHGSMASDATHLVLIPSYNTGARLASTVSEALEHWRPVWVVIDGSTDGSEAAVMELQKREKGLRVLTLKENAGKGAAVLEGMRQALEDGFTHVLVMDADGQHPAHEIQRFMAASMETRDAMILGVPQFGAEAPKERIRGRKIGNWWTQLETLWGGIEDSLFGFRVYPIADSVRIMTQSNQARRYDFETVLAVRLYWEGIRPVNIPVAVRYFTVDEGGVSHFNYLRDNLLLIRVHAGLVLRMIPRIPRLLKMRRRL